MAKEISEFMGITPDMQRMDSLMVAANIRNLSVLELFYTCVANLAKVMEQRDTELPEAVRHYTQKDDYNHFIYHQRNMDAVERTVLVMHDAEKMVELCDGNGDFDDTSEYQLLIRLLRERTVLDDGGSRRLRRKEEIEEPSKVLLNPSDPEATFRKKAGGKHLEAEPIYTQQVGLVADGAYSGEANILAAQGHNIRLVTTNFTGNKRTRMHFGFKIAALNFQKLLDYTNSLGKTAPKTKTA